MKLKPRQVKHLRYLRSLDVTYKKLAKRYRISLSHAFRVANGHAWAWLGKEPKRRYNCKLDPNKVRRMRLLYEQGTKKHELAKKFGVCKRTVYNVVTGRVWKYVKEV